ncbi:MAG: phospholipid/cholesterol/gamma-HCH transport system substrate-binding protein [Mycobacterium sp.]|jgi:virulence factor Mce-like protein|nr:phospholipid/cholesterol/gamma-HCH transport system substrate-binding protein [Mycobacterium sp.]
MSRTRRAVLLAGVLVLLLVGGATFLVRQSYFGLTRVTAYFTSATGIYPGDEVRVLGVKVGTITAIEPAGTQARMTIDVDHGVPIPADAKAVIVAQSLVAARFVQLAPAYAASGPTMLDGAVIPVERTAIPVEWDEVKSQLMRLATDLGPRTDVPGTSVSRFIDSAADALAGNGDKLRKTLAELSGVGRILADGSGNLVETIKNLQTFVTALRDSNEQIVSFQDRFATLASVLNDATPGLDAALTDLSVAVGDVQRFIGGSRNQTAEQIRRLADVTQNLVDHKTDVENILHVAPNAIANGYNIYNPDAGSFVGSFVLNNFADPSRFVCDGIAAVADATSAETSKLCAQTLGPALRLPNFNYLPFPVNPFLTKSPANVLYSDPALAPGGSGPPPGPPDAPLPVSAYTGSADNPFPAPADVPPPVVAPGPTAPDHLPAAPSPARFPGAPLPDPPPVAVPQSPPPSAPPEQEPAPAPTPTLPQLLLPAEGVPS